MALSRMFGILVLLVLHLPETRAQAFYPADTTIHLDSMGRQELAFTRVYRTWIKLRNGQIAGPGFLFRLSQNSVTICDHNPSKLDSITKKKLVFTTFPDTVIERIELRRNQQVNMTLAGVALGGLVMGIVTWFASEDDAANARTIRTLTREDKAAFSAGRLWSQVALPAALLSALPKVLYVHGNKAKFKKALELMSHKTGYKIY